MSVGMSFESFPHEIGEDAYGQCQQSPAAQCLHLALQSLLLPKARHKTTLPETD